MRALVLALLAGCSSNAPTAQRESAPPPAPVVVGDAPLVNAPTVLPEVTFESLGGFTFDRSALLGKPVVVVFVATTDPASKAELAMLAELANKVGDQVKFLGVLRTEGDIKLEIRDFLQGIAVPFPIGRQTSKLADAFMRPTAPTTFVFDRTGKRIAHPAGPSDGKALAALLETL